MRFEYDPEVNALYVRLGSGRVNKTLEVDEGVYVDLDSERHPLGLEFIDLACFDEYMKRHGGLVVPDYVTGPESLLTPA